MSKTFEFAPPALSLITIFKKLSSIFVLILMILFLIFLCLKASKELFKIFKITWINSLSFPSKIQFLSFSNSTFTSLNSSLILNKLIAFSIVVPISKATISSFLSKKFFKSLIFLSRKSEWTENNFKKRFCATFLTNCKEVIEN